MYWMYANPFCITSPLNKSSIYRNLQSGVLLTTPRLRELSLVSPPPEFFVKSMIRENLNLPENYPDSRESVNESVLVEFYKKCETEIRCQFLSSILKDGQYLDGFFLPYPVYIFKSEV